MESKVLETLRDSNGSLRKTKVMPFCLEKTKMTNPDSLMSLRVIARGIVKPLAAAKGCGDAKLGLVERKVLSGFACTRVLRVRKASPLYTILKMPRKRSSARSPTSRISRDGGVLPRFSSVTTISSTMIGGFGDLFSAFVSISRAREVSAINGDQLKLKAIFEANCCF